MSDIFSASVKITSGSYSGAMSGILPAAPYYYGGLISASVNLGIAEAPEVAYPGILPPACVSFMALT